MSLNQEEIWREILSGAYDQNPLRDFFNSSRTDSADAFAGAASSFNIPRVSAQPREKSAKEVDWKAATFKGFVGAVSAAGWKLALRRVGSQVNYSWRSPSGQLLSGMVYWQFSFSAQRKSSMDVMLAICAALAGWDPAWQNWRKGFTELGVKS